jgi:hypothetical protein
LDNCKFFFIKQFGIKFKLNKKRFKNDLVIFLPRFSRHRIFNFFVHWPAKLLHGQGVNSQFVISVSGFAIQVFSIGKYLVYQYFLDRLYDCLQIYKIKGLHVIILKNHQKESRFFFRNKFLSENCLFSLVLRPNFKCFWYRYI